MSDIDDRGGRRKRPTWNEKNVGLKCWGVAMEPQEELAGPCEGGGDVQELLCTFQ